MRGIGRRIAWSLTDRLDRSTDAEIDLLGMLREARERYPRMPDASERELAAARHNAEAILERAQRLQIEVIGATDSNFPTRLKRIPDAPVVLYLKGNVGALGADVAVAVVGTRSP